VEDFEPGDAKQVRVYHCGPTVYKRQHLGNWRRFLFADFLHRTLLLFGYGVKEVTNITDVGHLTQDDLDAGDDKLAAEAKKQQVTPQDIAQREATQFMADLTALNILPSDEYPRATDHIADMQDLIAKLLETRHAYQTASGIYFDVTSFPDYGKLSGNTLEQLEAGKRVEVRDEKQHPADFALWIFDDAALQKWDSPWGVGYPGWHIECSAMSLGQLDGPGIDIHTGGIDNKFPHHENEIAQSEAVTGKPFVRYWLHNAHLNLAGEKLTKREGAQLTLDTLLERESSPLAFRLLVFGSHYRSPVDFSWETLTGAAENLATLKQLVRRLQERAPKKNAGQADEAVDAFQAALADDLNTPEALAVVLEYVRAANTVLEGELSEAAGQAIWTTLLAFDQVLGVIEPLRAELASEAALPSQVQQLVTQREEARAAQDFDESDRLRQEIASLGYTVEDTDAGPRVVKQ